MRTLRLIITRHGETKWNRENRFLGQSDVELNDMGVSQAVKLAKRLKHLPISVIYSSDLLRSVETARIIHSESPDRKLIFTPLLRERHWGKFDGKRWSEIKKALSSNFEEEISSFRIHPLDVWPESGESLVEILSRINLLINDVVSKHEGETILLVGHGGVSTLIVKYLMKMDMSGLTPFFLENCSISIIDFLDNKFWQVISLNDVCHLKADYD